MLINNNPAIASHKTNVTEQISLKPTTTVQQKQTLPIETIIPFKLLPLTTKEIELLKIDTLKQNHAEEVSAKPIALKIKNDKIYLVFDNKTEQNLSEETKRKFLNQLETYLPHAISFAELGLFGAIIGTNIAAGAIGIAIVGLSFADPTKIALAVSLIVLAAISITLLGKKIYNSYQLINNIDKFFKNPEISDTGKERVNELLLAIKKEQSFFKDEYPTTIKLKITNFEKEIIETKETLKAINIKLLFLETAVNSEDQKKQLNSEKTSLIQKIIDLKKEIKDSKEKLTKLKIIITQLNYFRENFLNTICTFQKDPKKLSQKEKELLINLFGLETVTKRICFFNLYADKKLNLTPLNNYLEKIKNDPQKVSELGAKIISLKSKKIDNEGLIKLISEMN
ncbi:MAG: hypothetical protein WC860_08720 [Candidatus Margulisiibacteriota bacterium]|jgi:hypothetical protein